MSPKSSRMMAKEEDTRGCCGCFGWFFKLFRRKKRQAKACSDATAAGNVGEERQKDKELVDEEQEPKVVMTWAEEVDEAEEKGLDVFAPQISVLPHNASVHCDLSASPENEAIAAAATKSRMTACQRRKARRRTLAASLKASAKGKPAAKLECLVSTKNEAVVKMASTTDDISEAAHSGTSATRRRRARRKALAARINSEARLVATTEESSAPNKTHLWPSPSVWVYGSDGLPFVTTWEEAAYGAFHSSRV